MAEELEAAGMAAVTDMVAVQIVQVVEVQVLYGLEQMHLAAIY